MWFGGQEEADRDLAWWMATVTFQHSSTPAPKNPFPPAVLCAVLSFLLNIKGQVTPPIELFKILVHMQWVGGGGVILFKIPGTKHLVAAFSITECWCRSTWAHVVSAAASDHQHVGISLIHWLTLGLHVHRWAVCYRLLICHYYWSWLGCVLELL